MQRNGNVIVVGTGITGLAIALELLRKNEAFTLVGPGDFAGSATVAAGAMVDTFGEISNGGNPLEPAQISARMWAQEHYSEWLANIAEDAGTTIFHRHGIFVIGNSGGDYDIEKLALMRSEMASRGVPFEDHSPGDVPGLHPNVRFRAFDAIYMPTALTVDTTELVRALHAALTKDGRCNWIRDVVTGVQRGQASWRVETAGGVAVEAGELVIAAGAFSRSVLGDGLWDEAGLPPLYYGRGASCVASPVEHIPHAIRTPNRALACGLHMVPRANETLYLGATNLFGTDQNSAATGPTLGELHTLLGTIATQLNTRLRNVAVRQINWGLRPITGHDNPIVGRTMLPGLSIATGAHRTGVHLAPYLSKTLVADLLGNAPADANSFAPQAVKDLISKEEDFALGIRSLIATTLYPDGAMPYNRARELEIFMAELFRMSVSEDIESPLRDRMRRLATDIKLDEQRIIRIFHEVLRERIPDEGPYVL